VQRPRDLQLTNWKNLGASRGSAMASQFDYEAAADSLLQRSANVFGVLRAGQPGLRDSRQKPQRRLSRPSSARGRAVGDHRRRRRAPDDAARTPPRADDAKVAVAN
jgi:hypothetical protein